MKDKIINAVNILDEVDEEIKELPSQLSQCDSKLSDLRHILEDSSLNAVQCCHFVKEMQKVCIERRKIKNNMELGATFIRHNAKLNNDSNRKMLLVELHKTVNKEKKYTYRTYSEEELIELGILRRDEKDVQKEKESV